MNGGTAVMIEYYRPSYSLSSLNMKSSIIRDMFRFTSDPEMISFAGGLPGPEAFPVEELSRIINSSIASFGPAVFQYGTTEGYAPLREAISMLMYRAYGLSHSPKNIVITSGSQQALYLLCKILLNPGDAIITENPTYVGALTTFRSFMADIHTAEITSEGMDMAQLEGLVAQLVSSGRKPRFIYTIPSIHNPTGVTMGIMQRHLLYEIASKYNLLIIEDDPYGMIRYDGLNVPPVKNLDAEGRVIYLGSFSKTVSPGMRTGWIAGQNEIIRRCVIAKQGEDTCSSTLSQYAISEFISCGGIFRQIERVRKLYRRKRDIMTDCVDSMMPRASYQIPQGGLFLWLTLPEGIDSAKLLKKSLENRVAFVPGSAFDPAGKTCSTIRLNFSYPSEDEIDTGISRISTVIDMACKE